MNGIDYLIDTNVMVYILQGNPCVQHFAQEDMFAVSCITEMELLGKFLISEGEKRTITRMLSQCFIIDLNYYIKQLAINIRQNMRMKLPDAIIAATALQQNLTLVSADKDFCKIADLDLLLITI
ncbi:MAG: type II toxin-antitoxin system VapC family toxin [Prevotellaceae bacterium]|jgi:predicted nucleic acid-binding protein|nr:type II toxin-antitoxin system VapC family toxin [Prevotellaceae bacterium]